MPECDYSVISRNFHNPAPLHKNMYDYIPLSKKSQEKYCKTYVFLQFVLQY